MPGDTDISHAVEERLVAIEGRLDELEGTSGSTKPGEESDKVDNTLPETPEPKEEEVNPDAPYDPSKPIGTTSKRSR